MDIRSTQEETPEGRIAAVFMDYLKTHKFPPLPLRLDYAEIRQFIKPYLDLEIVDAEILLAKRNATIYTDGHLVRKRAEIKALILLRESGSA